MADREVVAAREPDRGFAEVGAPGLNWPWHEGAGRLAQALAGCPAIGQAQCGLEALPNEAPVGRTSHDPSGASPIVNQDALSELAPSGTLRAGINLSNFLLVTGKAASGDPIGVAPDMARAIADRLGVSVSYVTFASPGELTDAAGRDVWDIGLIAAEPARAKTIAFTPPYVEIEATYMVPEGTSLAAIDGRRPPRYPRRGVGQERLRPLPDAPSQARRAGAREGSRSRLRALREREARRARRPQARFDRGRRQTPRRTDSRRSLHGRPAGGGHRNDQPCRRRLPARLRRGGQGEWTRRPV